MAVDAPPLGAQGLAEQPAEAVVGHHLPPHRGLVAPGHLERAAGQRSAAPCSTIASAAQMPVASAWPMPSPVMGSAAAAASPTNSTRPSASTTSSIRAGMGQARWGPSGSASGPSRSRMCGRASRSGHAGLHVVGRHRATPDDAETDVGVAVADGERPEVAGQEVGLEQHPQVAAPPPATRCGRTGGTRATRPGSPVCPGRAGGAAATTCRRRRSRTGPRPSRGRRRRRSRLERVTRSRAARHRRGDGPRAPRPGPRASVDEGGVELAAAGDDREQPGSRPGAGTARRGPPASAPTTSVTGCHEGTVGRVEPEVLEQAQRADGQPVAAELVAGEGGLVDHRRPRGRGGPG